MPSERHKFHRPMDTGETLEVTVAYGKGGMNFFNYQNERRGTYIHFRPVTVERNAEGRVTSTSFNLTDDRAFKILIAEMGRDNAKKVAALADAVRANLDAIVAAYHARDAAEICRLIGVKAPA